MKSGQIVAVHDRAIVVGAGMVGMAVARALSERFREVVVVERDELARHSPEHRRGVGQSFHIHNLTLRGQQELEELFPGFGDEAVRLGAVRIDHGSDVARCTDVGFCPLFETGFVALAATRALLEFAERRRFLALCTNVTLLENTRVNGLIAEGEGIERRATGVQTDHRDHPELRGSLVVDCSGRVALWKRWFSMHQVAVPKESVVDSRCGYASRFYQHRPDHPYARKAMTVDPLFPNAPRWGCISPLEDNQWVVTIGGFNEQYPPSDEAGFEAFAHKLQTPLFREWLRDATPVTPVRTFRRLEMRWSHFERLKPKQHLKGFLAVGDAAWSYNPLYGQGMSIGVTCARILRDELRSDPRLDTLATRYYRAGNRFAYPKWFSTALLDLAWPKTLGKRPWYTELSRRIGHTFLRACQFEDDVFIALLQALHMLKEPHQLCTPRVLLGLARYTLRRLTASLPPMSLTRLPEKT